MDIHPWSDREKYLFLALRRSLGSKEIFDIFKALGYERSYVSIRKFAQRQGRIEKGPIIGEFSREERDAIEDVIGKEKFEFYFQKGISLLPPKKDSLSETLSLINEHASKVKICPIKKQSISGEQVVVCLSDIHYGSTVRDPQTGEEIYNQTIALKRLTDLPSRLIGCIPQRKYAGVTIVLAGDIVDGEDIYPTHSRHSTIPVIDQVKDLVEALWINICSLNRIFPNVRVVCVAGNHGRGGDRFDERSNWDNVVYQQLLLLSRMQIDVNVQVQVSFGSSFNFDVNGWTGHVRHYGVRHDGTAGMEQKMGGWLAEHSFDFLICGHFHTAGILTYNGRYIFRNGAVMPPNDLADRMAKSDIPRQIVFGVSEETLPTFVGFLTW
jgi:hypothetical protein